MNNTENINEQDSENDERVFEMENVLSFTSSELLEEQEREQKSLDTENVVEKMAGKWSEGLAVFVKTDGLISRAAKILSPASGHTLTPLVKGELLVQYFDDDSM